MLIRIETDRKNSQAWQPVETKMTGEEHLVGLGKVISNFHALEHVLRIFLCEASGEKLEYPVPRTTNVAETHLTSRNSLKPIIEEYNAGLTEKEQQYRVDPAVVNIRDAIAHGRTASLAEAFPVTLYKFGAKNGNGQIPVERVDELTEGWFSDKCSLLRKQMGGVIACSKSRSYKYLK